jgi:hypothetical protein
MKRFFIFISLLIASSFAFAQQAQEFYSQEFGWRIHIPASMALVSAENQKKLQEKGADAIEKTYGEQVVNETTTLFMYQKGMMNYIEANHQPADLNEDYREECKAVNELVYETFRTQIPGASIDSASSVQHVAGLEFHVFKVDIHIPNTTVVFHGQMFSRRFNNRELAVNIMYVDENIGRELLDAWFKSKFE